MEFGGATLLVGAVTLVLLPLLAFLGSRQLKRMDEDELAGRQTAAANLKTATDAIAERMQETHGLAVRGLDELNRHKLHIAENYVSTKRFEGFEAALFKKLDVIEDKLDRKVDKGHNGHNGAGDD